MDGNESPKTDTEPTPWQYTPGQSISPGADPAQPADSASDSASLPSPADTDEQSDYSGDMSATDASGAITWSASEYVAHQKGAGWYVLLVIIGLVLAVVVYLIMRDLISSAVIVLATVIFAIYGAHKPRVLQYRLSRDGMDIGNSHFAYSQFRSFSVTEDGAFSSINLMPLKRFMPIVAIHFDPKDEDNIVNMLADRLPMEPSHKDPVDRLLQRIRF